MSRPARSGLVGATPASATPASATPASATPASATPASATPASATPAAGRLGASGPVFTGPADSWRRWRAPLGIVLVVLLGGALIALLQPSGPTGYLDPRDAGQSGARALADILAQRGEPVTRADTVESAEAAARGGGVTLVITSPGLLSARQLDSLAAMRGNLVLVAPVGAALTALAPDTAVAGHAPLGTTDPSCGLTAARLADRTDMGGVLLHSTEPGAWQCYPVDGYPTLVRYSAPIPATGSPTTGSPTTGSPTTGDRTITLLGTGAPLTNQYLAARGNAALALDLLTGSSRIVWLVPPLPSAGATSGNPAGASQSLFSLIPWPAYLVTIQLAIAVGLAAIWRMRRLGPLVAEPLPVIVRASETVEGHGHLYRSRRSRDRASAVLRDAALDRLTTRLALPRGVGPDAICATVAARTGREAGTIRATLFGPVPPDDATLVTLAHDIDTLEGEVRT
ncbi:MAG: hypothetical protein QOJ73_2227 [Streptosporangiaceae bacterium]|nr:hypothetical protein [Streptosporangiaceae bacterium]